MNIRFLLFVCGENEGAFLSLVYIKIDIYLYLFHIYPPVFQRESVGIVVYTYLKYTDHRDLFAVRIESRKQECNLKSGDINLNMGVQQKKLHDWMLLLLADCGVFRGDHLWGEPCLIKAILISLEGAVEDPIILRQTNTVGLR